MPSFYEINNSLRPLAVNMAPKGAQGSRQRGTRRETPPAWGPTCAPGREEGLSTSISAPSHRAAQSPAMQTECLA